jgi:hypothetical protein
MENNAFLLLDICFLWKIKISPSYGKSRLSYVKYLIGKSQSWKITPFFCYIFDKKKITTILWKNSTLSYLALIEGFVTGFLLRPISSLARNSLIPVYAGITRLNPT